MGLFGKKKQPEAPAAPMKQQLHGAQLGLLRQMLAAPNAGTPEQMLDRVFAPGTISDEERAAFLRELKQE